MRAISRRAFNAFFLGFIRPPDGWFAAWNEAAASSMLEPDMHHPVIAAALLCALPALAQTSATDPSMMGLLQPDAGVVIGVDVRGLMASRLGMTLREELQKSGAALKLASAANALESNFLNSVDTVLVSMSAAELAKQSDRRAGARPEASALILARGRFSRSMLVSTLGGSQPEMVEGIETFLAPAKKATAPDTRVAMLTRSLVVAGPDAEVRAAILRSRETEPAPARRTLVQRSSDLGSRNQIWALVDLPPDMMQKAAGSPGAQWFAEVRAFDLGLSVSNGFGLDVNLRTRSEQAAQSLAGMLQGLLAMAASQSRQPEATQMLQSIRIAPSVSSVRISMAVDEATLLKGVRQMRTTGSGKSRGSLEGGSGPIASAETPAESAPPVPKPPERNTIIIEGLDSGTVVIPVKPAQ